jgi:hypothetical protein
MILWEKDGWTLWRNQLGFILYFNDVSKISITVEAWELYEMAIIIKPDFAEIVSIGQPIMRVGKGN